MADLLFYQRVVPLNDEVHARLRIKPVTHFGFARKTTSAPILAAEAAECAREYPIVFARGGPGTQGTVPAVLLGLREQENVFVGPQGKWDGRHIPAFIRRYPFIPGQDSTGKMVVCFDEAAGCFDERLGEPLFVTGKPTPLLEHAARFLADFQQNAAITNQLAAQIATMDLLRDADVLAQPDDGREFRLAGMRVVDQDKFRALDREGVFDLFTSGALALIYAHLISLGNLGRLADRMAKVGPGRTARQ